MPVAWLRLKQIIDANQRFVLTSHVRPDCDALGSELAMAGVLEALGKDVRIVNGDATPPNLRFIDPAGKILALGVDIAPAALADADVFVVLDTSAWVQLGPMAEVMRESKALKIVIDHHEREDDLGAELFKDTAAEATGRLVVDAADALDVMLTAELAMPLFAAVATDTGWFRFRSTGGNTYRVAGRLVDAGAVPQGIYTALYEQDTIARLNLRGRILSRAETELDGRLIYTAALREDFDATGALPSDTEDVINLTLEVAGTEVAVIFVERPDGSLKVSFRSRGEVDCALLASQFGGGGHRAAAGATIDDTIDVVQSTVLDAVRAAMR